MCVHKYTPLLTWCVQGVNLPRCSPKERVTIIGEHLRAVGGHALSLVALARGRVLRTMTCAISSLQRHLPRRVRPVVLLIFPQRRSLQVVMDHLGTPALRDSWYYLTAYTRAPMDYERIILTKIASYYTKGCVQRFSAHLSHDGKIIWLMFTSRKSE